MESKSKLRKEILQIRDALPLQARKEKSRQITDRIAAYKKFQEADKVLLFASFRSEVDTADIFEAALKMGKKVYFPKVTGKEMAFYQVTGEEDLVEGYRGIREPEADDAKKFCPEASDHVFVLMPGAVFDRGGNRIGYGGGYYDKFLKRIGAEISNEHVCKMAVAFACQVVSDGMILPEEHDIQPDCIITEETTSVFGLGCE